ncbi:hypothetical protein L7F22_011668 [Adiantum nelumboides]|nr:hypothetical protein [Adiantum nelumboides]
MEDTPKNGAGTSTQTRIRPGRPKRRADTEDLDRVTFDQADLSDHEAVADNAEALGDQEPGTGSKHAAKDLKLKMPEFKGKKGSDPKVHIQAFQSWASLRELPRTEWRVFSSNAQRSDTNLGSRVFVPSSISIPSGEKVIFLNNKSFSHNMIFEKNGVPEGVQVELISHNDYMNDEGQQFVVTLKDKGIFRFFCEPHHAASMFGEITVT